MVQINLKVDDKVKADAEMVLNELGLSMSSAINIFLRKVVREQRIPFDLSIDPFYSKEYMTLLAKRVNDISQDKFVVEKDLIEVE
ncbi:MAG: type II toxin-antitoxin system RelB/DinJ family antitoxin [Peptostreptococcaceae bacterium]|nr:type II toxin-antitoxin system RelB/DinJ family antitoxin [Peptostreptococcaceae bacterium]